MKFVAFSLFSILLIQASLAAPKPFFFNTIAGISQGFGDRINGAIELGTGVSSGMANDITQGGINLSSFFGGGITQAITGMTVHGFHTMDELFQNITNSIRISMNGLTNRNIVRVVDQIELRLNDFGKRTQNVITIAEESLDDAKEYLNNIMENRQDDLYKWNDEIAQRAENASEETKKKIETLLDSLVESELSDVQNCADSILLPIENLHNQTRKTIEDSFPFIRVLISKIDECVRLDQRNIRATLTCATEMRAKLNSLSPFPGRYSHLLNEFKQVSINNYYTTSCIADVIVKIEAEKIGITDQVEKLLTENEVSQS